MRVSLVALFSLTILAAGGCGGDREPSSTSHGSAKADPTEQTSSSKAQGVTQRQDGNPGRESSSSGAKASAGAEAPVGGPGDEAPTSPSEPGQGSPSVQRGPFKPANRSEQLKVARAVRTYFAAIASRDGGKACSLLAAPTRRQILDTLGKASRLSGKSCSELLVLLTAHYSDAQRSGLRRLHVTKVVVRDETALATYELRGRPASIIPLALEQGEEWKVGAVGGTDAALVAP